MLRIGMIGLAQTGKDTAADYLIERGVCEKKYGFSYPLKDMLKILFQFTDDDMNVKELKEKERNFSCGVRNIHNFIFKYQTEYGLHKKYPHFSATKALQALFELLDMKAFDNDTYFEGNFSPRRAMQVFGTEVGRNLIDKDVWVDLAPEDCVLVDVRFPNEVEFCHKNSIPLIKIHAGKQHTKIQNSEHESEAHFHNIKGDYDVVNNFDEQYFKDLDAIIGEIDGTKL